MHLPSDRLTGWFWLIAQCSVFDWLPLAACIERQILCLHGGPGASVVSDSGESASNCHPRQPNASLVRFAAFGGRHSSYTAANSLGYGRSCDDTDVVGYLVERPY
jgi:hypothetical protein